MTVTSHFQAIGRGVVDLRDVVYFASLIAFFLYVNVETLENRRSR
jgi:ABC-2 type transport system permease protein